MKNKYTTVAFDTETTGLIKPNETDIKKQPYITEIFCAKLNEEGEIIEEFDQLVKVPVNLSPEITRITGITDDMLSNMPTFAEIAPDLAKFFTGVDIIVAHNLAFDRSMLANELLRCNSLLKFPWPRHHICTVEKTMHIEQRRLNLTALHTHLFGEAFDNAHRAKNDVLPLVRCYNELKRTEQI